MDRHKTVLELAIEAVDDRGKTYGHPREHFARTTGMINALFTDRVRERLETGQPMFTPEDWAYIMIIDKLARQQGAKKHVDNLTDMCGYARTAEKITELPTLDETREAIKAQMRAVTDACTAFNPGPDADSMIVAQRNPEGMPVLVVSEEAPD